MSLRQWACAFAVAFALPATNAYAQQPAARLGDISLEDLLAVEVTSVSKKEEALFRAPSAIAVVTGEDIRRSGATSIPDALRLVPGLQVASVDGNKWAVSARGFNSLYANKLLVLIDGRSIYNATFSGVHWDMQDLPMDEIERIEVIRGPGASLWGANAVNGVINIITKPARLTQGGTVALSAGSLDRGSPSIRYGGRVGRESYYRVFAKYQSYGRTEPHQAGDPSDDWKVGHVGFRLDAQLSPSDTVVASGSYSQGEFGNLLNVRTGVRPGDTFRSAAPNEAHGLAGLLRWNRVLSPTSDLFVQATFDEAHRDETIIKVDYHVTNVEFQHHVAAGRHDIVWGAGQRVSLDHEQNTFMFSVTPDDERVLLTNVFAQDQITIVPSVMSVTAGSKFEYSTLSGGSVQPGIRMSVSPSPRQNVWGAVSHAVRTPARVELGMRLNYAAIPTPGPPMLLAILGNPELKPEHVTAYEAGYRVQPAPRVQIDATAFYNRYRDLAHLEPDTFFEPTPAPAHLVVGLKYANHDRAETHGVETLIRVQPAQRWMVETSHTLFKATVIGATDDEAVGEPVNASSPSHQWQVKSRLTLPADVELDATLFRVGRVGVDPALGADVPSYSRFDLRLGWTFYRMFGVSLVGQNLFEPDHVEFNGIDGLVGSRIPRTVAARVTWQF